MEAYATEVPVDLTYIVLISSLRDRPPQKSHRRHRRTVCPRFSRSSLRIRWCEMVGGLNSLKAQIKYRPLLFLHGSTYKMTLWKPRVHRAPPSIHPNTHTSSFFSPNGKPEFRHCPNTTHPPPPPSPFQGPDSLPLPPPPPLRQQRARNAAPTSPTLKVPTNEQEVQQEVRRSPQTGSVSQNPLKEEQTQTFFIFRLEFNPLTLHIPSPLSQTLSALGNLTGEVETFHPDGVRNGRSGPVT